MDDLTAPLGQSRPKSRPLAVRLAPVAAVALGTGLLIALWAALARDSTHTKGVAAQPAAAITAAPAILPPPAEPEPVKVIRGPAEPNDAARTVTIIDGMSGKREEVVIGASPDAEPHGSKRGP